MNWLAENWLDLFGWLGSALLIVSLLQSRILRFRILNLIASLALLLYNALFGVWPMVGMNVATTLINSFFIVKLTSERHDATAFEVLQVGPRDAYFTHFLKVHAADIADSIPIGVAPRTTTWPSRSSSATRP